MIREREDWELPQEDIDKILADKNLTVEELEIMVAQYDELILNLKEQIEKLS